MYEIITWPDIQEIMEKDGFEDNSCLINDDKLLEQYGSSAYFVNQEWLMDILDDSDLSYYHFLVLTEVSIIRHKSFSVEATSLEEAKKLAIDGVKLGFTKYYSTDYEEKTEKVIGKNYLYYDDDGLEKNPSPLKIWKDNEF